MNVGQGDHRRPAGTLIRLGVAGPVYPGRLQGQLGGVAQPAAEGFQEREVAKAVGWLPRIAGDRRRRPEGGLCLIEMA